MGLVRSGFAALAACGLFGLVSAAGCSAEGGSDDVGSDTTATAPPPGAQLPSPSGGGDDPSDASRPRDAGKSDASVDAGPPPPTPGTPCTTTDEIRTKTCGACGKQSTICLAHDGGAATWTEYSACSGELAGGCIPGTTVQEACGNCGTHTKTCSPYCSWSSGVCMGQPPSSCTAGGVELSSAGCAADTYRSRTCQATCEWDPFTATCSAPPTTIEVPPTAGGINYTYAKLSSSQTAGRLKGTCPSATIGTLATAYAYVTVHNGNAKAVTVTIFSSQAPGGPSMQTELATYAGAVRPTTDTARKACAKGVSTFGDSSITGNSDFASLDGSEAVGIPAGGSVTVYLGGFDAAALGAVKLSVRTDKLD